MTYDSEQLEYHRAVQRWIQASVARFGVFVVSAVLVCSCAAQRTGSFAPAHFGSSFRRNGARFSSAYPSRFHRADAYASLPFPFFVDSFNSSDIYSTGYPVASEPPPFLWQAVRGLAGSGDFVGHTGNNSDREPSPAPPMMIELQNRRYVRVNVPAADGEALPFDLRPDDAQRVNAPGRQSSTAPVVVDSPRDDLPAAVLIFRDGHSEEVRDYTIADGALYARGDYYIDGYWNKKIDLANLNVSETLQANLNRNVSFVLPSSPNEVITRF